MFIFWILLWIGIFTIFFLRLQTKKKNSKKVFLGENIFKSVIVVFSISIPFTYLSYLSFGNWPFLISTIYVTVSISWSLLAIYALETGKSKLERYSLLTMLFLTPLTMLATSDDFERCFSLRLSGKFIPLYIFILLILGIYGWIIGKRKALNSNE